MYILLGLALFAVVTVLLMGLVAFAKGDKIPAHISNKLMRARVILQAVAILLLIIAFGCVKPA